MSLGFILFVTVLHIIGKVRTCARTAKEGVLDSCERPGCARPVLAAPGCVPPVLTNAHLRCCPADPRHVSTSSTEPPTQRQSSGRGQSSSIQWHQGGHPHPRSHSSSVLLLRVVL